MNPHKILYIGTSDIGSPLLQALTSDERFEVALVITQIDKPAGRKMELTTSPIKQKAHELGLQVFQPDDINSDASIEQIRKLTPDMIVLMAYGQILKKPLLSIPEFGCINVHASLLPKHRGASPIQQSLLHNDEETGISIMEMAEKMDAGPVFATFKLPIDSEETALTLHDKLAQLTAQKTPDVLIEILVDGLRPHHQDHQHATYCAKIRKADGAIDWNEPATEIVTKIRAFAGWPGTYTFWDKSRLKIQSAKAVACQLNQAPGMVINDDGIIMVSCKTGALALDVVQMEGKNSQAIAELIRGHPDFIGSKLN